MCSDAWGIRDHLPIRPDTYENRYIRHLLRAFFTLEITSPIERDSARPFSIMPLHLLFMVAVQYKILRIYRERPHEYEIYRSKLQVGRITKEHLREPKSPTEIAYLKERFIVDFLKIGGSFNDDAKRINESIIEYRNDKIAHAKGHIELDLKKKINEYFDGLEDVQTAYQNMNRSLAKDWLDEIQSGEDIGNFLERRFLNSLLCPRDLVDIIRTFVTSSKLDSIQLEQALQKLNDVNTENTDDCSRFKHIRS